MEDKRTQMTQSLVKQGISRKIFPRRLLTEGEHLLCLWHIQFLKDENKNLCELNVHQEMVHVRISTRYQGQFFRLQIIVLLNSRKFPFQIMIQRKSYLNNFRAAEFSQQSIHQSESYYLDLHCRHMQPFGKPTQQQPTKQISSVSSNIKYKIFNSKNKNKKSERKMEKKHNFPQNEKVILGRQKMRNGPAGVK